MAQRSTLIDALKVCAAQLIVLHHMVLYAPMADRVASAWPAATAFLMDPAIYAVQVFLVIGGFLAAHSLAQGVRPSLPRALLARYLRLVPMLAVALLAVLAASALLPRGRWPDWVTPWPTASDFAAHLLLLQDVLHLPSLSAGAWYVSIDFQLHALLAFGTVVLCRQAGRPVWRTPLPGAVAAMTLASLLWFNRDAALDVWALYFFGAYGLGALAGWARHSRALAGLFAAMCAAQLAAVWLEPRPRVWIACLTAIALATLASRWPVRGRAARWLAYWGDASYGVFVIHYAVIVAATALWLRLGWDSAVAAWSLLLLCWAASLWAGATLQQTVGNPLARWRRDRVPSVGGR